VPEAISYLANVPLDKCAFRIHQAQLVVQPAQRFRDCANVSDHTNRTLDRCKVSAGDDDRRLVVNADLEPAFVLFIYVISETINAASATIGIAIENLRLKSSGIGQPISWQKE
jgi:hypothetical protein